MHHTDRNIHRSGFTSANPRAPLPVAASRSPWPVVLALLLGVAAFAMLAKALLP